MNLERLHYLRRLPPYGGSRDLKNNSEIPIDYFSVENEGFLSTGSKSFVEPRLFIFSRTVLPKNKLLPGTLTKKYALRILHCLASLRILLRVSFRRSPSPHLKVSPMKRFGILLLLAFAATSLASPQGKDDKKPQGGFFDKPEKSKIAGFNLGEEFEDQAPEEGLLVGFNLGYGYYVNSNNDIIISIQPIYRVGDNEKTGKVQGTDNKRVVKEVAKPGYAVAGIHAKGALTVDGFYITYMKVDGNHLDPNDSYNSKWFGGPGGNGPTDISGNGRLVVGIHGRFNNNKKDIVAIGLIFGPPLTELIPVDEKNKPEVPKIPKCARFIGGWNDPEFTDVAPKDGLLVGFDIAYGGLGNSIITIQPTYQVKGKTKDVVGQIHGTDTKRRARDRAKPGYAVGALTVKGALWVDGFSITYMKIADDKLDPTDSYESAWFGNDGRAEEKHLISGEGEPAVGILGRQGRKDLNALGLVFKKDKEEKQEKKKK
jgi:hypothetical protein